MLPTPAFPILPPPESPSASAPPSAPPFPDHFSAPDLSTLDPEYAQQPPACYLPDGTPLALTYDRREIFLSAFPEDYRYPETPAACSFLLFLASHPRTVWNAPVPDPEDPAGLLAPLHSRPDAFRDFIDGWKARTLTAFNSPAGVLRCQTLARRLWTGQHANQPILPGSDSSEKKNPPSPPSPPPGNSADSSLDAIPSVPAPSIKMSPSGISTPCSTATSSGKDSTPPPPPPTAPDSTPSDPASILPSSTCEDCNGYFHPDEITAGICPSCEN